ncbi:ATP-binding protein [Leeuwenhoekiella sp. A16]|uniref:GAF domain-containing sensor histidine kinase n=1 Tax=unclassified Leeuwenhoekiella TaxID=2615029 RepID=UPI003A80C8C3
MKDLSTQLKSDIKKIQRIGIVPQLLDVVCRTTGMGFAAIARVTEDRWVTCSTRDQIAFGLKPGDELKVETTLCNDIRQSKDIIVIDHVDKDDIYCKHPTPAMYKFQSYISVPIIKKDGSFFGTLCSIDPKPAKVNRPEITGMFELFAELISFHLNAIEELEDTEAKLKHELETSELREQFIAILGHDLKNPVGTTRMSAELLLKMNLDERATKYAGIIKSTSFRMEGLIDNLLDFARGRLGEGIQLKKEINNKLLLESVEQVIKEIQAMAPESRLDVNIQLDYEVNCDRERVAQLFSNLLGNAITHGAPDKPIQVEIVSTKNMFSLAVKNQGEKIPQVAMDHLFQPFYRQNLSSHKQGLGLGLYISSEIANAHGGQMNVASTAQETVFTFIMPCK